MECNNKLIAEGSKQKVPIRLLLLEQSDQGLLFAPAFPVSTIWFGSCADPEGVERGSRQPLENHKAIGFLINTGMDTMGSPKATKTAFNVRPPFARQGNAI